MWLSLLPIAIICHPPSSHLLLRPVAADALVAPALGSGRESGEPRFSSSSLT
jgi:hypothetical protein